MDAVVSQCAGGLSARFIWLAQHLSVGSLLGQASVWQ